MAFEMKTWTDRLVEFAGRRKLTKVSGDANGEMVVDVTRAEGNVSEIGDAFSSANMNDLEQRIADGFSAVNSKLIKYQPYTKVTNQYGIIQFIPDMALDRIIGVRITDQDTHYVNGWSLNPSKNQFYLRASTWDGEFLLSTPINFEIIYV